MCPSFTPCRIGERPRRGTRPRVGQIRSQQLFPLEQTVRQQVQVSSFNSWPQSPRKTPSNHWGSTPRSDGDKANSLFAQRASGAQVLDLVRSLHHAQLAPPRPRQPPGGSSRSSRSVLMRGARLRTGTCHPFLLGTDKSAEVRV